MDKNNNLEEKTLSFAQSLNMALFNALKEYNNTVIMGEDIGKLGGVFRITADLQKNFGSKRVIDTPLSETGIVGMAFGMSLNGMIPIVEIQFDGFIYMCFNQIISHISRVFQKFKHKTPIIIRVPYGGGINAIPYHEESPEALFLNIPHLETLMISEACESAIAFRYALSIQRPVLIFESKKNYWKKSMAIEDNCTSVKTPRLLLNGNSYTVITYGAISDLLKEVLLFLNKYFSLSCDMFKLINLSYFDKSKIFASIEKNKTVIIVHESHRFMGYGAELASEIYEKYYKILKLPILRIGSFRMPYPATAFFKDFLPSKERLTVEISNFLKKLL